MGTRKIKDAKDIKTEEKIYFKGHAKATYMSDGVSVEDTINNIKENIGNVDLSGVLSKSEASSTYLNKNDASSTYLKKTDASNTYLEKTAKAASATKADSATKATQDGSGNVITTTYATKSELSSKVDSSSLSNVAFSGLYNDLINKPENVQSDWNTTDTTSDAFIKNKPTLATVATSGSYNDLNNKPTIPDAQVNADWNATSGKAQILNKPTIPSAVTESTVSGWGFTKNTGTYSKPSNGIPKTDLASAVQTSLSKADTALQSHQDISGKQDKNLYFTDQEANTWINDNTSLFGCKYYCKIYLSGVTANDFAQVTFSYNEAASGNYAQVCETGNGFVKIWSAINKSIVIPLITILKKV